MKRWTSQGRWLGCQDGVRSGPSLAPQSSPLEGISWSWLLVTSLVPELTALVRVTKRPKNTALSRQQLEEFSHKVRKLLISLERETSRTGGPEGGQKRQGKQLPTSVSANQPANMKDTGQWAWMVESGPGKTLRKPDSKLRTAKEPSRD